MLKAHGKALTLTDKDGCLPLHLAIRHNVSDVAVTIVLEGNPGATQVEDNAGRLPLLLACLKSRSDGLLALLHEACPWAIESLKPDAKARVEKAKTSGAGQAQVGFGIMG